MRRYIDPYPHLLDENVLTSDELGFLLAHWPEHSEFALEVPGNYALWFGRVWSENASALPDWRESLPPILGRLIREILAQLAPWIIRRFGRDIGTLTVFPCLMEADAGYSGIGVHNHHYHSPHWLATTLVYLDEDPAGFKATSLVEVKDDPDQDWVDRASEIFIDTLRWGDYKKWKSDKFEVHRELPYRQNTMLAFLDSPVSYHASTPVVDKGNGDRRVLRFHLALPWQACEERYGVTLPEYRLAHPEGLKSPDSRALEWAKQDILELLDPVDISVDEAFDWACGLSIVVR